MGCIWGMLSDDDVVSCAGLNGSATTVNVVPGAVMIVWVAEVWLEMPAVIVLSDWVMTVTRPPLLCDVRVRDK
jgi:hypothetical protein